MECNTRHCSVGYRPVHDEGVFSSAILGTIDHKLGTWGVRKDNFARNMHNYRRALHLPGGIWSRSGPREA